MCAGEARVCACAQTLTSSDELPLRCNSESWGSYDAVLQELESCKLLNSMDGSPIQGVYITLRMRLLCTIYRCARALTDDCNGPPSISKQGDSLTSRFHGTSTAQLLHRHAWCGMDTALV